MKIFISWSGDLSNKYAKFLKEWIEQCIQSAEVFYSKDDIEKGEQWNNKLSLGLQDSCFGIVCLTSENIGSPWMHFEAGALAKTLASKVATLAININISDIKGPLSSFQATKLEKDDIFKLIESINNAQEKPLDTKKLEATFNAFWPKFEEMIKRTKIDPIKNGKEKTPKKDEIRESIDEILQLVRNQNNMLSDHKRNNILEETRRIDEIMYSVYDYMKTSLLNYKWNDSLVQEYSRLANKITFNNPLWNDRFKRMIFGRKFIYRKNDLTDDSDE